MKRSVLSLSSLADRVCPPVCRLLLDRVQSSPIGRRIAGGMFWSVAGNGFGKVFTFAAMILVARILGKDAFGEFGLIQSTAVTFVTFSGFAMGVTSTKYIAELLSTDKERVGRIIGLNYLFTFFSSLVVAGIFYFSVPWICETKIHSPHLISEMQWGAVLLFLMAFTAVQFGIMSGFQDFKRQAAASLLVGILSILTYVAGAVLNGLHGAVLGLLSVTVINVFVNSYFIFCNTKKFGIRYSFCDAYKELPIVWKFTLPTMLCAVTYGGTFWICQMILGATPNGSAELGIFYAGMSVFALLMFVPMKLRDVMLPMLSEQCGRKNRRLFHKTALVHFGLNTVLVMILILPVAVFSQTIMGFFGGDFVRGYGTLSLLCVFSILYTFGNNIDQIVLSQGKAYLNLIYGILGSLTTFIVSYYLIQSNWGSFGLALGILMGHVARIVFFACYFPFFNLLKYNEFS